MGHGHQRLFEILARLDHVFQVLRRELQAPRIRQRVTSLLAENEQVRVRQGDDAFLAIFAFGPHDELDVHGIGMSNRDAGLQPAELDFPGPPERIGPGLEAAEIIRHNPQGSKAKTLAPADSSHSWRKCRSVPQLKFALGCVLIAAL
jgi:hypothetical protein